MGLLDRVGEYGVIPLLLLPGSCLAWSLVVIAVVIIGGVVVVVGRHSIADYVGVWAAATVVVVVVVVVVVMILS